MKKKAAAILSLAVLIPALLFVAGIIAQFILNTKAWQAAGGSYQVAPKLPSVKPSAIIDALLTFPEGLMAIGGVVIGVVLICVFGLRIGWGTTGTTDRDRNLVIAGAGSYGTASFMSARDAEKCFEMTTCAKTDQDILGMTEKGKVITLPRNTRLNANLSVCGASGTGKSRSASPESGNS